MIQADNAGIIATMSEGKGIINNRWVWRLIYSAPVVIGVIILIILSVVNPLEVGAIGILVVFLLFYTLFLAVSFIAIRVGSRIARMLGFKPQINVKRAYYLATVVAVWPVFILALNSIGQLQLIDMLLVTALVGLGCFYVIRQAS